RSGRRRLFVRGDERRTPAHGAEQGVDFKKLFHPGSPLERFRPGLAAADAYYSLEVDDEDLAVADLSRVGRFFYVLDLLSAALVMFLLGAPVESLNTALFAWSLRTSARASKLSLARNETVAVTSLYFVSLVRKGPAGAKWVPFLSSNDSRRRTPRSFGVNMKVTYPATPLYFALVVVPPALSWLTDKTSKPTDSGSIMV